MELLRQILFGTLCEMVQRLTLFTLAIASMCGAMNLQGPHLSMIVNAFGLMASVIRPLGDADSPLRVKVYDGQVVMCV